MSKQLSLETEHATDNSDQMLASLLERLKMATDPETIRPLSAEIERVTFHKQFENARRGIEARKRKEEEFYALAKEFRQAQKPAKVKKLGNQLGRIVFG